MAKYRGSSWGTIIGKVGEGVGSVYHGIPVLRGYIKTEGISPIVCLAELKNGTQKSTPKLIRRINSNLIFSSMATLAKTVQEKTIVISTIWKERTEFSKVNTKILNSLGEKVETLYGINNLPDITKLQFTKRYGAPGPNLSSEYNPDDGQIAVKWDNPSYVRGTPKDTVYLVIVYFKLDSLYNWTKQSKPWQFKVWANNVASRPIAGMPKDNSPVVTRKDGNTVLQTEKGLNPKNLVTYIFFYDTAGGFSQSYSCRNI
ncbi:MAG: hypothetical protein PHE49_06665 [bacterium]|nr:hypothetical protein [bacterium]